MFPTHLMRKQRLAMATAYFPIPAALAPGPDAAWPVFFYDKSGDSLRDHVRAGLLPMMNPCSLLIPSPLAGPCDSVSVVSFERIIT